MEKIFLRPLEKKDAERMLEWMRDPEITRYLQIGGPSTTLEQVLAFVESASDDSVNLHRAIVNEADEYLGTVSLKHIDQEKHEAEYAISMHPSSLGTGVSKEGTQLILEIAFEKMRLDRVYLNVLEENQRAIRFYRKNRFQYTHTSMLDHKGSRKPLLWFEVRRAE